jgi:hypothetical protein
VGSTTERATLSLAERPPEEADMQIDDMIIVSVDDHVVEPPDMF